MTSKDIIASRSFQTQEEALKYFGTIKKLERFLEFLKHRQMRVIDLLVERGILEEDEKHHSGYVFPKEIMKKYKFSTSDDGFEYFLNYLLGLTDEEIDEMEELSQAQVMKKYIIDDGYAKGVEGYPTYFLDKDLAHFWNEI